VARGGGGRRRAYERRAVGQFPTSIGDDDDRNPKRENKAGARGERRNLEALGESSHFRRAAVRH